MWQWIEGEGIPANHAVIGTCSRCRGPVTKPFVWHGLYEPIPRCLACGAYAKQGYGPTIQTFKVYEGGLAQ